MIFGDDSDDAFMPDDWRPQMSPYPEKPDRSDKESMEVSSELHSPQESAAAHRRTQPASPQERFNLTVMGTLFSFFEAHPDSVPLSQITAHVKEVLDTLRRSDGSKYSRSVDKVVNGCLSNSELFIKDSAGWSLRVHNAEMYKERIQETLQKRAERRSAGPKKSNFLELKKSQLTEKTYKMILLFERLSRFMKSDKKYEKHFKRAFRSLKGSNEISEAVEVLGQEKFLGVMQGFEMLKDYYSSLGYNAKKLTHDSKIDRDFKVISGMTESVLSLVKQRYEES